MALYLTLLLTAALPSLAASQPPYQPCPLRGPIYPPTQSLLSSPPVQKALENLTLNFDQSASGIDSGNGLVIQNTTSLSIALFSTTNDSGNGQPFFYQYHKTASECQGECNGTRKVDANSIYRIGDISMVFTSWLLLITAGSKIWERAVIDILPELASAPIGNAVDSVVWSDVTVGDLAGHLAGIGRDYGFMDLANGNASAASGGLPSINASQKPSCDVERPCSRDEFFAGFTKHAPVYAPSTAPIYSHAAYQILGYVLANITGDSEYASTLANSITNHLGMDSTTTTSPADITHAAIVANSTDTLFDAVLGDLSPAIGLYSTAHDLSIACRAILSSSLLSPLQTRRWLQPTSFTSNLVNTVGRPWEIYAGATAVNASIVPTFTKQGWLGAYSSYIGLVPDYNIGFVILAADPAGAPDLNAHADIIGANVLPAAVRASQEEAVVVYVGRFQSGSSGNGGNGNDSSIEIVQDGLPGLSIAALRNGGQDVLNTIAEASGIKLENLDFRLYPTNLATSGSSGSGAGRARLAWRAVLQDKTAPVDAGTPTCVTWQNVDQLVWGNLALDEFVFDVDVAKGKAMAVEVPALRRSFGRV